jgi:imidazole glycerol-phosphate synthase subunit HisH
VTQRVAVIDYGMGNLHSVASGLEQVGASEVVVSHEPAAIAGADRVVFPGVGGIRDCMEAIRRLGCDQLLDHVLNNERKPVLAICVGMQALMTRSEENQGVDCLGTLPGQVRYFGDQHSSLEGERLKVPHMGWNAVMPVGSHPLWEGIAPGTRFYFVHSYHVVPDDPAMVAGSFEYGLTGCAALARENLFATQFHPEKSHTAGLTLLKNFLHWDGTCS